MYIRRLELLNFRTYPSLDLELPPGLVVFHGANAQGKTNLLEACHLLALARSFRAENDREMVHWDAAARGEGAMASGTFAKQGEALRVVVGLQVQPRAEGDAGIAVRKQVRVNGLPRLASELVGMVGAVLFTASDVDLVLGPPAHRRRFLDVVASQGDPAYLRALQRYVRVLAQRNALLRAVRERRAGADELAFWDGQLVAEGLTVVQGRVRVLEELLPVAAREYGELSDGEPLHIAYVPTVDPQEGEQAYRHALEAVRARDLALGATHVGPHRDDLRLSSNGTDMTRYASRGQARTIALALHLAQAAYLWRVHGEGPVLLLDDVLSELDVRHRRHVLEKAAAHQQALLTTSALELLEPSALHAASLFHVQRGTVTAAA